MKKGADYDLKAKVFGENVNIEVKSKRTTTRLLNGDTLSNTLKRAHKQLPKNQIGLIFLEVPVEWTKQPDSEIVIIECINKFFMNTTRVKKIILFWKEYFDRRSETENTFMMTKIKEFGHTNFSDLLSKNWLLKKINISWDGVLSEDQFFKPSFCLDL